MPWTIASRSDAARSGGRIQWGKTLIVGGLWGLTTTAGESLVLPFDGTELARFWFLAETWPQYALDGVLIATVATVLQRRTSNLLWSIVIVIPLALALAGVSYVLHEGTLRVFEALDLVGGTTRLFQRSWDWWEIYPYVVWMISFYGGLFMIGRMLSLRSAAAQMMLIDAEVARNKTEAALAVARMQAMQGGVEPEFLLRAMAEVQRRYASRPIDADALLDQLVNFLRDTMPGLRTGQSTLISEIELAQAYAHLASELDPQRGQLMVIVERDLPDIRFPPLLLLPVIEQLGAALAAATRPGPVDSEKHYPEKPTVLSARSDGSSIQLSLTSTPVTDDWLRPDLMYRFRVALAAAYQNDWALTTGSVNEPEQPILWIRLPIGVKTNTDVPMPAPIGGQGPLPRAGLTT